MTNKDTFRPVVIVRAEIRKNNAILFVKRSNGGVRPGQWELPGGKIDKGETLSIALQREVLEETGYACSAGDYITDWTYHESDILGIIFTALIDPLAPKEPQLSEEHSEFAWLTKENYMQYELDDEYKDYVLNRLYSNKNTVINTSKSSKQLNIFTDGGSRGNPGPSATGYVIYENETLLDKGGSYLGVTTNNQAEYHALLEAAKLAQKYNPEHITFFLDSQLVVNQMTGKYKIKNKDLWPVHQAIKETVNRVDVDFKYIPREDNTEADAMVNNVLDNR